MAGGISNTAIGLIMALAFGVMFMTAINSSSSDPDKATFQPYTQQKDTLGILNASGCGSGSFGISQNTNDTASTLTLIGSCMANEIAQSQTDSQQQSPADQLLAAFGLVSSLVLKTIFLVLAVFLEGLNFIFGIFTMVNLLPYPWSIFGNLIGVAVAIFVIITILRIVSVHAKWEI